MKILKIMPPLANFGVIALITLRTLKTDCFNATDINLSLMALVFAVVAEIIILKRK